MKTKTLFWLLNLLVAAACPVQAKLNLVATTSDLAAIAEAIGGSQVTVTSLAKPTEDPHFVDPKPSFIVKLNRADALIEGGAQLEMGWLSPLLQGARNRNLAVGAPGRIMCSQGIALLEVPPTLDRSQGDIHAVGNPHYLVDPANAKIVAERLCEAFCRLDAANCAAYRANLSSFLARLQAKVEEWTTLLKPYAGSSVVAYHNTWPYLARRFNLKIDLFLEPKPGIPPTPAHLAEVITRMKSESIRAIIVEPYQNQRTAESVAGATGAKLAALTQYPGGVLGTEKGYLEMIDHNVRTLAAAMGAGLP